MHELVIAAGVAFLLVAVATALVVGLVLRSILRSNRVVPDRRSSAPITWLWSWSTGARLHRRLRRAVQVATYVVAPLRPGPRRPVPLRRRRQDPPASPLFDVADTLMARAALLDDRLVAASRMEPRWRSHGLAELGGAVAEVEASTAHLGRVAAAWRVQMESAGPYDALPALDVRSRLSAVEAALVEVANAGAAPPRVARAGAPDGELLARTPGRAPG